MTNRRKLLVLPMICGSLVLGGVTTAHASVPAVKYESNGSGRQWTGTGGYYEKCPPHTIRNNHLCYFHVRIKGKWYWR